MKDFFKYLLATILGILIASILGMFIFFGVLGAMLSQSDKPVDVKPNSILVLDLENPVVDRAPSNPFDGVNPMSMSISQSMGLNNILKAISNAAEDPNIKGIYIENRKISAGAATLDEIRNALLKFKESGKFIVAYSDGYSHKTYYLASVADKVMLNPEGMMEWAGLSSQIMFYKNAFDKLGVEPQVLRHGKFKSAVEPYILDRMSPENREQTSTFMGSIWNHWLKGIAAARGLTVGQLNALADGTPVHTANASLENRMIDSIVYKDQVLDYLKSITETPEKKDLKTITLAKYTKVPAIKKHKGLAKDKIAVVYASGQIVDGKGGADEVGGDKFAKAIRKARQDSTIKAIVLRINSPGGSALASEVIWRELVLAKQAKPLVVSMGDLAASGGYYIAAPGDTILANPTTITGSIGVFGLFFNIKDLMNKKLGLTVDAVNSNKYSDFASSYRPLTADERKIGQDLIENVYKTFVEHVSEGRGLAFEEVDNIGQGRVWSGANAIDIGLVDQFAGLERAIEIAAERAAIDKYRIVELPKQTDFFEELLKDLTGSAKLWLLGGEANEFYNAYERMKHMVTNQGILARIPFDIEIH